MYAKIVSKCKDGQRFIHTAEGVEEISEEEYTAMLIKQWTSMDRDMVYMEMEHLTKK